MNDRAQRKLDHVRLAVAQASRPPRPESGRHGWAEVHLVHHSLPELAVKEIDLATELGGVYLKMPLFINAMTGGAHSLAAINSDLAEAASALGVAMAVGSQKAAIDSPDIAATYRIARQRNPKGVLIANLGADAPPDRVRRAVDMIEANLVQLHLNAPQELVMWEGDRDFRGILTNIETVVGESPVPVIVKECGFGMSRETVRSLYSVGVRTVDISGRGGTNFALIEADRTGEPLDPGLAEWGLSTPISLIEVAALRLPGLQIVASGGIAHGTSIAKALALGASAVGTAGPVLRRQQQSGPAGVVAYLQAVIDDLTRTLVLTGARSLSELRQRPVVIMGETAEWSRLRGVDLESLARRSRPTS